ncbi:mCG144922, isoform CRA_a, partial [Mus musculus]
VQNLLPQKSKGCSGSSCICVVSLTAQFAVQINKVSLVKEQQQQQQLGVFLLLDFHQTLRTIAHQHFGGLSRIQSPDTEVQFFELATSGETLEAWECIFWEARKLLPSDNSHPSYAQIGTLMRQQPMVTLKVEEKPMDFLVGMEAN